MTKQIYRGMTLATLAIATAIAGAQDISVTVNGKPVNFQNAAPRSMGGRVLVPLRGVFEEMGADVSWRPAARNVIATKGSSRVTLHIGDPTAMVDGREVRLDVPAMIVNGTTMVPIRFVSESLGADVHWNESQQLVEIISSGTRTQRINPNPPQIIRGGQNGKPGWNHQSQTQVIEDNTIIPVSLDEGLSSNGSRRGDHFSATVRRTGNDYYSMFPAGTKIEGRVVAAHPQRGNEPGLLELDFQQLRMPNGRTYNIDGRLVSLDANGIDRGGNGRMRATGGDAKDNRNVYAGYGAGAGLVLGLLTDKPIEGTVVGGLLGYLAGQAEKDKRNPKNVRLEPGTRFGVRLTQQLVINTRDIR